MIDPIEIQIRFSDLDVLGHVNNSVYLSYFEIARVHYFGKLLGTHWDWKKHGVILVKNEVEYLRPILLNDRPKVYVYTEKIGTKSFELSYEIKVKDHVYTKGSSVLVSFDAELNQTTVLNSKMKDALESLIKE